VTEAEAIETICARFATSWGATQSSVPFALGNEALPAAGVAQFAALSFGNLASKQITQGPEGSRRFEHRGQVMVKLFGALDAGDAPLAALLASVKTALDSQSLGGSPTVQALQTYAASAPAPQKQGAWYTRVVAIPFVYYETR
jgi:hypothetical protein